MKHTSLLTLSALLIPTFILQAAEWVSPLPELRYDEVTFLTAHNAFASREEGFLIYKQQKWGIQHQLDKGVRALTLDTHTHGNEIMLCHGKCGGLFSLQMGMCGRHKTLNEGLDIITGWMARNPSEIVTLFIENHSQLDAIHDVIANHPTVAALTLNAKDWDLEKHHGRWPSLAWMTEHNKRLVIFIEKEVDTCTYPFIHPLWSLVIENIPGSLKTKALATERPESQIFDGTNRSLLLFNLFAHPTLPAFMCAIINSYRNVKTKVEKALNLGLGRGKIPNFINLDFVNRGSALKYINELNEMAADMHHGE